MEFSSSARESSFSSRLYIPIYCTYHLCTLYSVGIRVCYEKQKMKKPLSEKISYLSPGWLTTVINLYIRIYSRMFVYIQNGFYRVFRGIGKLICEKTEAENLVSDSL